MPINISVYKDFYLETTRKLIEEYVRIKASPETENTVKDLFRIFHSLKGRSDAMGYKNIATLSLQVETLCRTLSENKLLLPPVLKELLPRPEVLYDDLDSIEKTNEEISLTKETEEVQKIIEGISHT